MLKRAVLFLALALLLASASACMENVALIGRPTIPEGQDDIVGEVVRVDMSSRRIYLRSQGGTDRTVAFSPDARVLDHGRDYPIGRLARGDIVALQTKQDSRGDSFTDLIRIQENSRTEDRNELSTSAPQIQALSGRVDRVNLRGNSFDLEDQPGRPIVVVLSANARDSDRQHFRDLRTGDHVRVEGRFTDRERFELLSFLNDEPSR
ncbi:MAG TPA: hypothetical protein VMT22_12315 [Terriglobales bacterium]|nr:hypothetical protein [Terriglobales bacterium]